MVILKAGEVICLKSFSRGLNPIVCTWHTISGYPRRAADKLSALAWRIPDRVREDQYDDPAVVRHVHDLALLKDAAEKSEKFPGLVMSAMEHDDRRSKHNTTFSGLPVAEKFQQMFAAFDRDEQYRSEYDLFVKGVSYAPEGEVPDFDAAMDAVRRLTKIVTS